jgi:hypothetical protein
MGNGAQLRYGAIKGGENLNFIPMPAGASEVFRAKSGRFVKNDGSGRVEVAVDGTTLLEGWVESGDLTCSSTEGATIVSFVHAVNCLGTIFRIPINAGTFVATMRGKTCDLAVSSNIQGAKLDGSGEDTVIIVDGDLVGNAWVDVIINPDKIASLTGVV